MMLVLVTNGERLPQAEQLVERIRETVRKGRRTIRSRASAKM